jgi:hypothetical protein
MARVQRLKYFNYTKTEDLYEPGFVMKIKTAFAAVYFKKTASIQRFTDKVAGDPRTVRIEH